MHTRTKNGQWFIQSDDGTDVARMFGSGRFPPEQTAKALAGIVTQLPVLLRRVRELLDGDHLWDYNEPQFAGSPKTLETRRVVEALETVFAVCSEHLHALNTVNGTAQAVSTITACSQCREFIPDENSLRGYCRGYSTHIQGDSEPCDWAKRLYRKA